MDSFNNIKVIKTVELNKIKISFNQGLQD